MRLLLLLVVMRTVGAIATLAAPLRMALLAVLPLGSAPVLLLAVSLGVISMPPERVAAMVAAAVVPTTAVVAAVIPSAAIAATLSLALRVAVSVPRRVPALAALLVAPHAPAGVPVLVAALAAVVAGLRRPPAREGSR